VENDPKLRSVPRPADDPPLESREDDDLMLLARGGVPAAFDVLVRRHQRRMLRVAARYLGRDSLAPDVVQNAFIELYRALPRYQARGRFTSYVYRVLLNQCRQARRGARLETHTLEHAAGQPAEGPHSDEEILARERQRDLDRAVGQLSEKLRSVVLLRYTADLDYAKIAETLDVPLGTVKRRLFDAVAKLQETMGKA